MLENLALSGQEGTTTFTGRWAERRLRQSRDVVSVYDESGLNVVRLDPGPVSYSIVLSEDEFLQLQEKTTNNP